MTKKEVLLNFIEFNPQRFLKESKTWASKLKEIEKEIAGIPELPAIESSGVMSSGISDLTFNTAIKRMKLENDRQYYLTCIEILDWAMSHIPSFDRELIEGFFFPKISIYNFVEDFGRDNGLCRSDVYAARREALENFNEIISTKYGL